MAKAEKPVVEVSADNPERINVTGVHAWAIVALTGVLCLHQWGVTQYVAHLLNYQKELGEPWFVVNGVSVYANPVDYMFWYVKFGLVPGTAEVWTKTQFAAMTMLPLLIGAMLYFHFVLNAIKIENTVTPFNARWATVADIQSAGLLTETPIVEIRRFHAKWRKEGRIA